MTELPRDASMDAPIHVRQPESSGLKTVTVFVIVLLFHVAGIVGFLIWQYNHQGNPDANLTNSDRTHTDSATPDSSTTTTTPSTATGDSTTTPSAPATATTPDNSTTPSASGDGSNVASTASTPEAPVVMPNSSSALNQSSATVAPTSGTPTLVADTTTPATPSTPATPPTDNALTPTVTDSKDTTGTPTTTAPDATTPATGENYVVKHGDTLAKIAKRHHVKLADLRMANNMTTDAIKLGETLVIPAKVVKAKIPKPAVPTTSTHAVLASSTTPAPADASATPAPAATTPAPTPAPADASPAPADSTPAAGKAYTVVHGDTMTRIAHKFHVTTTALIAANPNIADPAKLAIGDKLTVPAPTPKKKKKTPTPAAAQ